MKRLNLLLSTTLFSLSLLITACVAPVAPVAAPAAKSNAAAPAAAADDKADWPKEFVVGFFASDDAEKTLKDNEPIRVYLEEKLGVPVKLVTGTSYTAVIEAMRAKRADGMLVGPFAYVLAVQEAQAEAMAISIGGESTETQYNPDAPTHYYSVIFTKKGSGIATLEDLKGKDFAFVDPASTSGHLAPKTLLIKNSINPDSDMKTVFAGSHATSVLSVWTDKVPAGATFENNLYTLANEGQVEFCGFSDGKIAMKRTAEEIKAVYDACPDGKLAIISYTEEIPSTPFAVRSDLPESFKKAVKDALLAIKDSPELVSATRGWYVDPSESLGLDRLDQYYNSLRDIAKLLNLDLKELAK